MEKLAPVLRVVIDLPVDPTVEVVRDDAFKDEFLLTIMYIDKTTMMPTTQDAIRGFFERLFDI